MIDKNRFPEESKQTRRLDKFIDSVMFSSQFFKGGGGGMGGGDEGNGKAFKNLC